MPTQQEIIQEVTNELKPDGELGAPAHNHSDTGQGDYTNGALPLYRGTKKTRERIQSGISKELAEQSKARDLLENPPVPPGAEEKTAGTYRYGQTIGEVTGELQTDILVAEARVREAERAQLNPAPLELSESSTEHDLSFVAKKSFVLQSATGNPRDLRKGDAVSSEEAKSHAKAKSNVERALTLAKQRLKEAENILLHRPDVVSERLQFVEHVIDGYLVKYQVDMSYHARGVFEQDIEEARGTRARCIKSPDGVMTWIMPHADMVVPLSMEHVMTPEPVSSLWDYRQ